MPNAGIWEGMAVESVTCRDPDVLGGVPVFRNTRVPVRTLFDFLEAGDSLDDFLRDFPSVTREQATRVMEEAREALLAEKDATASR